MEKFTTEEAARYLGCSKSKLEKDRCKGSQIPWQKVGRLVFYLKTDLDTYLARRTYFSTSEYGGVHG